MLADLYWSFRKMGNTQTTHDVNALVEVTKQQANTQATSAGKCQDYLTIHLAEQKRVNKHLYLLPGRLTAVTLILLRPRYTRGFLTRASRLFGNDPASKSPSSATLLFALGLSPSD